MSAKVSVIPRSEWIQIQAMYLEDWPKYSITYSLIDHALKNDKDDIKLFSCNEDYSDGSFVYVNRKYSMIHSNTLTGSIEKLKSIVKGVKGLALQSIIITSEKFLPMAQYLSSLNNLHYSRMTDIFLHIDKAKALEMEIPQHEDVILKPLTLPFAEEINNHWPHSYPGSLEYIKSLIVTDYSMGAFDKTTGELMAWVLRYPTGCFGMLQVKEKYFRKGLGRLVTITLAKKLAKLGLDSTATAIHDNCIGRKFFKSVGFTEHFKVNFYDQKDIN